MLGGISTQNPGPIRDVLRARCTEAIPRPDLLRFVDLAIRELRRGRHDICVRELLQNKEIATDSQ